MFIPILGSQEREFMLREFLEQSQSGKADLEGDTWILQTQAERPSLFG